MHASGSNKSMLRRFSRDARGNTAIMFGLSLFPLIGFVGAGVDYSMSASQRTKLQAATDATTLAIAQNANKMSDEELLALAKKMVKAEMGKTPINVDSLHV